MNKILLSFLVSFVFFASVFVCLNGEAYARPDRQVRGYVKQNGTAVQSYRRTNRDYTRNNNYSTRGNINPYHGKQGTKPRDGEFSRMKQRNLW